MIRIPQKIKYIKIKEIFPNPYQTRRNFNSKSIEMLAQSIKTVGILSPIIVRAAGNGYELVSGQRRVMAANAAGLEKIPAVIIIAGDRQCAQISIIENIQRENLSFFEEAEGFFNLMSYHRVKKEDICRFLAVESGRINEKVRLLSLTPSIRYKVEENVINEKTARSLLKLHDEDKQNEIIKQIAAGELSQKETEFLVKQTLREMSRGKKGKERIKITDMPLFVNTVKKTAELLKKSGARVETEEKETDNFVEITLKIHK